MSSAIGLCVFWRSILLISLPFILNSFLISGIKYSFINSRKGFFSIGGSFTGFVFAFTFAVLVGVISLGIFLSAIMFDLLFKITFLFSSDCFSVDSSFLSLSTFSADLIVALSELEFAIANLKSSDCFSKDSSLLTLSIFSADLLVALSEIGSAKANLLSSGFSSEIISLLFFAWLFIMSLSVDISFLFPSKILSPSILLFP